MTTQVFRASIDSYVDEGNAGTNYGKARFLRVNADGARERYSFIHFPLAIPADATIISAVLTVYLRDAWSGANTLTAKRITQKWKEGNIAWTGKPSVTGAGVSGAVTGGVDGEALNVTMTTLVQDWVGSAANLGIRLEGSASSNRDLYSSESAHLGRRPVLTVTWSRKPDAPRNLRAGGGRGVSGSKPFLLWDSVTPSSVQPLLDNDSSFASPLWDPGYVNQTDLYYDPAALTALADNTLYYWKVRIKDENGVASDYAAAESFYYRSLGSLAITSGPSAEVQVITLTAFDGTDSFKLTAEGTETVAFVRLTNATAAAIQTALRTATGDTGLTVSGTTDAGPFTVTFSERLAQAQMTVTSAVGCTGDVTTTTQGGIVQTTSPTIGHTLTGRTQAWTAYDLFESGVLVWSRERQASTTASVTIPEGYIRDTTKTYILRAYVWDTLDREAVGALPTYATVDSTFALAEDAATGPVTGFTATQSGGGVNLNWSRATAPAKFLVRLNGVIIEDDIDPNDAFVSGTAYAWKSYGGGPWAGSQTWEVLAENASILSASNPTSALAFNPVGIWLIDETDDKEVCILGREPVESAIGESGATYFPLGRRDPVRIVDSIRGFEGSVSGELMLWAGSGQTLATARDAFLFIKGHPGNTLRLVYGRRSFPVIIAAAELELTDNSAEEAYKVDFDFFQTGEFDIDLEA